MVATPIGNLGDFSPRGVETLERADFIAAEDTRVSMKLMNHFGIKKPLVSYHEHNRASAGQTILTRLLAGETCALVTDAGTPAISDPGEDLVRLCGENNIAVEAIPGCCAAICALAVSGLPTGRFTFEGFLSANKKERRTALLRLQGEERTMVFHEAPHKLRATLSDMAEILGDRPVALCRELTKLHEETLRTTLSAAVALYAEREPRGEYVLVVAGARPMEEPAVTLEEGVSRVQRLREDGIKMKEAVRSVAGQTALNKNELYDAVLKAEKYSRNADPADKKQGSIHSPAFLSAGFFQLCQAFEANMLALKGQDMLLAFTEDTPILMLAQDHGIPIHINLQGILFRDVQCAPQLCG